MRRRTDADGRMHDGFIIEIEMRTLDRFVREPVRVRGKWCLPPYELKMGSHQQVWCDPETGLLGASADPRRATKAWPHLSK
jgi:hypothetical protein